MKNPNKKSWLSFWNILICGFFLFGIVSLFYWKIFNPTKQSPNLLPSPMINYVSKENIYSLDYPASWAVTETPQGEHGDLDVIGTIGRPGYSIPRLMLASHDFKQATMENVIQWGIDRAKSCREFQQKDQQKYVISGRTGIRLEYTCLRNINFLLSKYAIAKCFDYYVTNDSTGYALSFCALEDQWGEVGPVFEQMIKSFSLK